MSAQSLPLQKSAQVVLDGSGDGTVSLGPTSYNVLWTVSLAAVRVSSSASEPQCRLYLGPASDPNFIGGTYSGSQDSTDLNVAVPAGLSITARWENGDPGATATLSLIGTQLVG